MAPQNIFKGYNYNTKALTHWTRKTKQNAGTIKKVKEHDTTYKIQWQTHK